MQRIELTPNFVDNRGYIVDLIESCEINSITLISFEKNSIRANHFHKLTTQWNYVIEGEILLVTESDERGRQEVILKEGDFIITPPNESHALKGLTFSKLLIFTSGPRSGENYESDTYRLEKPLI